MATYCARNRLTKVAKDVESAGLLKENIDDVLDEVPLCRKVDQVGGVSPAALTKLKATPPPGLLRQ